MAQTKKRNKINSSAIQSSNYTQQNNGYNNDYNITANVTILMTLSASTKNNTSNSKSSSSPSPRPHPLPTFHTMPTQELSQLIQIEIDSQLKMALAQHNNFTSGNNNNNDTDTNTNNDNNAPVVRPKVRMALVTEAKQIVLQKYSNELINFWPPIEHVLQDVNTTNKTAAQHVLDFAIIGFPKCGTSTMMFWLGEQPEIAMFDHEVRILQRSQPLDLIQKMYDTFHPSKVGPNVKRGYKSPADIESINVQNTLTDYFPSTKLIVGIRHPILWFQSFYNFRVQNGKDLPPLTKFKARCYANQGAVCANRANFHSRLAAYGITPMTDHEINTSFSRQDQKLLREQQKRTIIGNKNPIFLYDTTQLVVSPDNTTRLDTFKKDLQKFLGLQTELSPMLHYSPGKKGLSAQVQAERDARKINICEEQYTFYREMLLQKSKQTSSWIQTYLISSISDNNSVTISNMDHFLQIIESYNHDPCIVNNETLKLF